MKRGVVFTALCVSAVVALLSAYASASCATNSKFSIVAHGGTPKADASGLIGAGVALGSDAANSAAVVGLTNALTNKTPKMVLFNVKHLGAAVTATNGYDITCSSTNVISSSTCNVPAGTQQNGVVGCAIELQEKSAAVPAEDVTCTGPAAPVAFDGVNAVSDLDKHVFKVAMVAAGSRTHVYKTKSDFEAVQGDGVTIFAAGTTLTQDVAAGDVSSNTLGVFAGTPSAELVTVQTAHSVTGTTVQCFSSSGLITPPASALTGDPGNASDVATSIGTWGQVGTPSSLSLSGEDVVITCMSVTTGDAAQFKIGQHVSFLAKVFPPETNGVFEIVSHGNVAKADQSGLIGADVALGRAADKSISVPAVASASYVLFYIKHTGNTVVNPYTVRCDAVPTDIIDQTDCTVPAGTTINATVGCALKTGSSAGGEDGNNYNVRCRALDDGASPVVYDGTNTVPVTSTHVFQLEFNGLTDTAALKAGVAGVQAQDDLTTLAVDSPLTQAPAGTLALPAGTSGTLLKVDLNAGSLTVGTGTPSVSFACVHSLLTSRLTPPSTQVVTAITETSLGSWGSLPSLTSGHDGTGEEFTVTCFVTVANASEVKRGDAYSANIKILPKVSNTTFAITAHKVTFKTDPGDGVLTENDPLDLSTNAVSFMKSTAVSKMVLFNIKHTGEEVTRAYDITCQDPDSAAITPSVCTVPVGTQQNGYVGCAINLKNGSPSQAYYVVCRGPDTAVTYGGSSTVDKNDSHVFKGTVLAGSVADAKGTVLSAIAVGTAADGTTTQFQAADGDLGISLDKTLLITQGSSAGSLIQLEVGNYTASGPMFTCATSNPASLVPPVESASLDETKSAIAFTGNVGAPKSLSGKSNDAATGNKYGETVVVTCFVTEAEGSDTSEAPVGVHITGQVAIIPSSATNSVFSLVSHGGTARGDLGAILSAGTTLGTTKDSNGVALVDLIASRAGKIYLFDIKHNGSTVTTKYDVTCLGVAGLLTETACEVPEGTTQGQTVPCVLTVPATSATDDTQVTISCRGPATPVQYDGTNWINSDDQHQFGLTPQATGSTVHDLTNTAEQMQGTVNDILAAGTTLTQINSGKLTVASGATGTNLVSAKAGATATGAALRCFSSNATILTPPSSAVTVETTSAVSLGTWTVGDVTTDGGTDVTVSCFATSAGGSAIKLGQSVSVIMKVLPAATNNVFRIVSNGIALNAAGTALITADTALGRTDATGLGVRKTSAKQYYAFDVLHSGGTVTAAYQVTCDTVDDYTANVDVNGTLTPTTCTIPKGTTTGAKVPCLLQLANSSGVTPSATTIKAVRCRGPAAGGGTKFDGTNTVSDSHQHHFNIKILETGTGAVSITNKEAQLQADAATPLNANTVLGETDATTLTALMGTPSTTWLQAKSTVASGTGKLTCRSMETAAVPIFTTESTNPLNGTTAIDLDAFPLGEDSTDTTSNITCVVSSGADGTVLKLGQIATFRMRAYVPFRMVAGAAVAKQSDGSRITENDEFTTTEDDPAKAPQIVAGSLYFGGLAVKVQHKGPTVTVAYAVTCVPETANNVIADVTCVVPVGTAKDGYVPCDVLPGATQTHALTKTITCSGPAAAVAYDGTKSVSSAAKQVFSLEVVGEQGRDLVFKLNTAGENAAGQTLGTSVELGTTSAQVIPRVWESASSAGSFFKVSSCTASTTAICKTSSAAFTVGSSTVTTSEAGVTLGADAVPAATKDTLVHVSCGVTGVEQAAHAATVSVLVKSYPTFTLYSDAAGTTALPTTAANALAVPEGTTFDVYAKVTDDLRDSTPFTITCTPEDATFTADATGTNGGATITGTSSAVEVPGQVLSDKATFKAAAVTANGSAKKITCATTGTSHPIQGSVDFYAKVNNTAVNYSIVDSTGKAIGTSAAARTAVPEGQLTLSVKVAGDVPAGAGTITCVESGSSSLTLLDGSVSYSSGEVEETSGMVLTDTVSFNTLVSSNTDVTVRCTGDGNVFDSTHVDIYLKVLDGASTTDLQCEMDAAVASSGLEVVGTTATDKATVKAMVDHVAVVIEAGSANKSDAGTARVKGTTLFATDKTEVVEGTTYTAGSLFQVRLSEMPPENVTVTCKSGTTETLPDSGTATDYTLTFTTSNATTPQGIKLGVVAPISSGSDVTLTCTARSATLGMLPTAAATIVRATPLAIIVEAGTSAVNQAGTAVVAGTNITGGTTKVARMEGVADANGNTVRVRLNGNPTANVEVQCKSGTTSTIPDSTTSTDYTVTFTASNGTTAQGIKLGTVAASHAADTDVMFTCTPSAAGGLTVSETVTFTVHAQALRVVILAGSAAVNDSGVAYTAGSTLAGTSKVARVEGLPDSAGGTIQVKLTGNPSADVVVTCRSNNTSQLPDSATASDYTVTFSSTNGTTAQSIELGTVQNVASPATVEATVNCQATAAAGGLGTSAGESASVVVVAQRLAIKLLAGTAAVKEDGSSWTSNASLTASDKVVVTEGVVDTAGATLKISLNGNAIAKSTVVTCISLTQGYLPNPATNTFTFFTTNGLAAQNITLATPTDVDEDMEVTFQCAPDANGGMATSETVSVKVLVQKKRIMLIAGSSAVSAAGTAVAANTVLTPEDRLHRMENTQDQTGATLKLRLSHNPTATTVVTCVSSNTSVMPTPTTSTFTFTATNGTTAQDITLQTIPATLTADTDVSLVCSADGAADVGKYEPAMATIAATKLKVVIVAGSSARNATTSVSYTENSSDLSGKVAMTEGVADSTGATLKVRLNGLPTADVTVTCESNATGTIANPSGSLTFTSANGTTPQGIVIPTPGLVNTNTPVTITCKPGGTAGGLTTADTGSAVIEVQPISIMIIAGTAAMSESKTALVAGTDVTGGGTGKKIYRLEGVADSPGTSIQVKLSANPIAPVTVTCRSGTVSVLPDSGTATDYTLTFTATNGTVAQSVKLGTVVNTLKTDTDVAVTCTPSATGGFQATESKTATIYAARLQIEARAGSDAKLGAAGVSVAEDTLLTANSVLRVKAGADSLLGEHLKVSLNGNPLQDVTLKCTSIDTTVIPNPSTGFKASFTMTSGTTPKGVVIGVPPFKYEMFAMAGAAAVEGTATPDAIIAGTQLVSGQKCLSPRLYEGQATTAGDIVKLKFNGTSSGKITCASSDVTAMASIPEFTVSSDSEANVPLPVPAAVASGTKTVTYTCEVTSDAAGSTNLTPGQEAKFDVIVFPLGLEAVIETGVATGAATSVVRQSDGTTFMEGESIGYASAAPLTQTLVTPVIFEGAGNLANIVALKPTVAPSANVAFTCSSESLATKITADDVQFTANSTAPVNITIPSITGIDGDTKVTFTCVAKEAAGGFTTTAANHKVSFDLFVRKAALSAIARSSAINALASSINTGTVLSTATKALNTTLGIYESSAKTTALVSLVANVAPGAEVTVTCESGNGTVLDNIPSITIGNNTDAVAIEIPAPKVGVTTDTPVTYTCKPTADAGNLKTSDSVAFWVHVLPLRIVVEKGSAAVSADATALSTDISGGGTGKTIRMFEGAAQSANLASLKLNASSTGSAEVTVTCTSDKPTVLADLAEVKLTGTSLVGLTIPSPGIKITSDQVVTFTCAPSATGGLATSDIVQFQVKVVELVVTPQFASTTASNIAADGISILSAVGTELVAGDAGKTVSVVELAAETSALVRFTPNAAPTEQVTYTCVPSVEDEESAPLGEITVNVTASTSPASLTIPQSTTVARDTLVQYTCTPNAAGGIDASDIVVFDVMVRNLRLTPVAGGALLSAARTTISSGSTLVSDDATRTPEIATATDTDSGAVVQLSPNGAPSTAITIKCASNDSIIGEITDVSFAASGNIDINLPVTGETTVPVLVKITCGPASDTTAGLLAADVTVFDVLVAPRRAEVVATATLSAADGSSISSGTIVSRESGPSSAMRTIRVSSGESVSNVALRVNSSPSGTNTVVKFTCTSSRPEVIFHVADIEVTDATNNSFTIPRANEVDFATSVAFTCAPAAAAGGYTVDVVAIFNVLVIPVKLDVVAAGASVTVFDAAIGSVTSGTILTGTGIAARTVVVYEGQAADPTAVALKASFAPELAASYTCVSSNPAVMSNITNISISSSNNITVTLPVPGSTSTDITVTYTCDNILSGNVPTPEPTASATTVASTTAPVETTAAATQAAVATATATATSVATTAPVTLTPAPVLAELMQTVKFDIRVLRLVPRVHAQTTAVRSDTLLNYATTTDISNGVGVAPLLYLNQTTESGTVVKLGLNAAPTAEVTFNCESNNELMGSITGVKVTSATFVNLALPKPTGTMTGDVTVVYTCKPAAAAGGLEANAQVTFDVRVHHHGFVALAGANATSGTNFTRITAGTYVGYTDSPSFMVAYVSESSSKASTTVSFRTKTNVNPVDVSCASSDPEIMADFALDNLTYETMAAVLPTSAAVSSSTKITYTCTVECQSAPYSGTEMVKFDVLVLARSLIPVAGTLVTDAVGGSIASGALLRSGEASLTPSVMELASASGLVKLFYTVPPGSNMVVRCSSDDEAVFASPDDITFTSGTDRSVVGGAALDIPIAASANVVEEKTVTFTCLPTSDVGGYMTTMAPATFDVLVKEQTIQFVAGSVAGITNSRALAASGAPLKAGTVVTYVRGLESASYKLGEFLRLQAVGAGTIVSCAAESTSEGSPALVVATADPTRTASVSSTFEVPSNPGTVSLYVGPMPSVSEGSTLTYTITCSPTTVTNGYSTSDAFSVTVEIMDDIPPAAVPPPLVTGRDQVQVPVNFTFAAPPSAAEEEAIIALVPAQVVKTLAAKDVTITEEDVTVVKDGSTSARRKLTTVTNEHVFSTLV